MDNALMTDASRELTCKELVELVTDYFDDVLSPETRRRFEEHLTSCPPCQIYLEQMHQTIRGASQLPDEVMSQEGLDVLLAHFRRLR
jgi:anti-sigma factor RsiW